VAPSRCLFFFASAVLALGQTASLGSLGISSSNTPDPITAKERVRWVVASSVGPASLAAGLFSAGWGTLRNVPREYGPHWQGYGERYGMRLTGIATSNVMEAGLGAIWGEDPRYVRAEGAPVGSRIGHIMKMTFLAHNRDGKTMPAYARYIAIPGHNFLSNTWRADSEATASRASIRIGLGFLGRLGGHALEEFWPDVRQRFFSNNPPGPTVQHTVGTE
jgi:hypothetical protein